MTTHANTGINHRHRGHIFLLKLCKQLVDVLILMVNHLRSIICLILGIRLQVYTQ